MAVQGRLRGPVRWFGGKGNMVAKLLQLLPEGNVYAEPYFGGGALFFAKMPHPVEAINDLDGDLICLFRMLQDKEKFQELRHRLMWTLYARDEFVKAIEILKSDNNNQIDRAWAKFVFQNMVFGGKQSEMNFGSWGRSLDEKTTVISRWVMRLSMLDAWHYRLMNAQIDNIDALDFIKYWDSDKTVFYIDPPYIQETRINKKVYAHECDDSHHKKLVEVLLNIKGKAMISGYAHEIYIPLEMAGWERIDFKTACHAACRIRGSKLQGKGAAIKHVPRIESVWIKK